MHTFWPRLAPSVNGAEQKPPGSEEKLTCAWPHPDRKQLSEDAAQVFFLPSAKLKRIHSELLQTPGSQLSPGAAVVGRRALSVVCTLRVFSFYSATNSMRSSLSQQTAKVIIRVVKVRQRWWVLFVNPLLILNIPPSNLPRKHLD